MDYETSSDLQVKKEPIDEDISDEAQITSTVNANDSGVTEHSSEVGDQVEEEPRDQGDGKEMTLKSNIKAEVKEEPKEGGAEETEVVSEDELPEIQKPSVKDAQNVSDYELPGPKPADLPAETEVVSEDELPSDKKEPKESRKRKTDESREPRGNSKKQAVSKLWKPARTPEMAETSGSSGPKKARRSFKPSEAAIMAALDDSGSSDESEDYDCDGDQFIDFWYLRHSRLGREDASADDCEERVDERVEERVEERAEERVEEDAELGAIGQEFPDLNDFSWSEDFTTFTGQKEVYLRTPGPSSATEDPVEIFMKIWNKDIMEEITRQTNKYAWVKIAPFSEEGDELPAPLSMWTDTSSEELYRYFAILILMSVCHMSVVSDYWSTGLLGMPDFRRLMTRNRFVLLTRFLHFVDNDDVDPTLSSYHKKIQKIKPILDHCNAQFSALYTPTQHLSLDESLLLWKGSLSWVQCIRSKAARIGIKSFELCEAESGYLLRCLIYGGKNSTMLTEEPIHGFENSTAKVVLELMDGFLDAGHILVMDNWYNQLSLIRYLKRRGTDVIGTMNPRRVNVPNDIKEAKLKKLPRGSQIARHCGDITLIAWQDVKLVTAVSTCHADARESASRVGVDIEKPVAITEYNKYMGGVDLKDQKLSMFLMERKRGRKWYMKVFKRLLNTSLLNAFIIYQKTPVAGNRLTHREFRWAVATGLLKRFPTSEIRSRPNVSESAPGIPRRLTKGVEHFPVHTDRKDPNKPGHKQQRCARCTAAKRRTTVTVKCSFCKVPLCVGTCWSEYHNLEQL